MKRRNLLQRCAPNAFVLALGFADLYSLLFCSYPNLLLVTNHPIAVNLLILTALGAFAMWLWCWLYTSVMDPGRVKDDLQRRGELSEIHAGRIPRPLQGLPLCPFCLLPQPSTANHCFKCGACHLRQDHHCVIVGQCIADRNMKSFLLSFLYAGAFTVLSIICSVKSFAADGTRKSSKEVAFFIVSLYVGIIGLAAIAFGLCSFWQSYHESNIPFSIYMSTFGTAWWEKLIPIQETTFLAWPGVCWCNDYEP